MPPPIVETENCQCYRKLSCYPHQNKVYYYYYYFGNCHVTLTKIKFIIIIIIIIIIENEIEESAEVLGRILVQNGNLIRRNSKRRKREVRMPQRSQFSTKMEILRRQVAKIRAKCRSYDPRERCYESRER
jgi:hypothetical protein